MLLSRLPRGRYIAILATLLILAVVLSGIGAHYPHDWWLENALVLAFVAFLGVSYRRLPLSRISYTLILLFLGLHEIGAHWTYSEVPYDSWTHSLFGTSLNEAMGWQRNHFDRLVHFSYGLLLAYPVREVFVRVAEARGFWAYVLPLDLTMSTSMIYELIEWLAAEAFGGELGAAYLGTQGDAWDAHKDMLLATVGAALAMGITGLINVRYQRDFAREFVASLRVKHAAPLGEDEIERMKRS